VEQSDLKRRDFMKVAAGTLAGGSSSAAVPPEPLRFDGARKMMGIQVGAASFVDEGVQQVLDTFQERASINTLFLAVFSYGRGIAGRQVPGQPLPDHGKQEYDVNFHGGNYAAVHPQYYKDPVLRPEDTRAPDHGNLDILEAVLPEAKKRSIRTICWAIDKSPPASLANVAKVQEQDLYGRNTGEVCFNNPGYRNFWLGLVEDYTRSYDIDGIMWASERHGPLNAALESSAPGRVGCFCGHCRQKASAQGINFSRVQEGYRLLEKFLLASRSGQRPVDGHYVTFWRILLRYPEILAWETFWNDSLREMYKGIYQKVKSIKPDLAVGWHIAHGISRSPLYRAEQDYQELIPYSDFLKMVIYNNCAGERMAHYVDSLTSTVFADLTKQQFLDFEYRVLNYRERGYDQIPYTGLSSDYVYQDTKWAADGLAGSRVLNWPGIDIDIPTQPNHSKCTRQGVKAAVLAAFRAGAHGVVLSRKYSEMKLDNLSGAGDAMKEVRTG
jgi:hypothetical protein